MEEYLNQPKSKKPVSVKKYEMKEEEGDENWETELVEQSYNPLEVAEYMSDWSPILCCVFAGHQEEECSEED